MDGLVYIVAYAGTLLCLAVIVLKVFSYLKKPVHIRWELYPVAHESKEKVAYGGSYLEEQKWWQKKQHASLIGSIMGILIEFSVLHSTFHNNRPLWYRSYPFHLGIYFLLASIFLTLFAAILSLFGLTESILFNIAGNLVQVLSFLGFIGLIAGGIGLLHRRLTVPDLRNYSSFSHFFNLGAFIFLGALGLITWLAVPSFFGSAWSFTFNMITFSFEPIGSILFSLYLFFGFIMAAYVPATHMGHIFMKYFLYHDIRWGDQPTQDNPKIQKQINEVLGWRPTWQAKHIQGDGKKTWAEIATTNPTAEKE